MTPLDSMAKPTKQSVTVKIGEFSAKALAGERGWESEYLPARLVRAIRLYLNDREAARPGWAYPALLPKEESGKVELELTLDEGLWDAFEREARKQGVSASQMAGYAALYYAAELDAGHITQRIVDELGDDES
jgi:hypothetical protein